MRIVPTETHAAARRAWDARSLLTRDTWRLRLPGAVGDELVAFCRRRPGAARDLERFAFEPRELPRLARFAATVREGLVAGDGLARVRGLADLGLGPAEQRLLYYAFGCAIGEPMLHYGRLFEVRDRGGSYKTRAIPVSMTGAETGFHTDSSARDTLPDVVGLLCERPSTSGGDSLVSNALRVHEVLRREAPGALARLYRSFLRDVVTPGVEKTHGNLLRNRFPVFARCERPGGLVFRYMRYWIEKGHERAGEPLSARDRAAFDLLDELLAAKDNVVRFRLEAGDVLWIDNRTLAHNRTGYEDAAGNVRRLYRMWLRVPPAAGGKVTASPRAAATASR